MSEQTQLAITPMAELQTISEAVAQSGLFGVKTPAQALTLMLLCQAEGLNPILALRRYHIIENRPSMRADAMAGEFESRGGGIVWHLRTDKICAATFFSDRGKINAEAIERGRKRCLALMEDDEKALVKLSEFGEETILRSAADAWNKGISRIYKDSNPVLKTNWAAHPRQMLTARVCTEGVRLVNPGLVAGIYDEDEIRDAQAAELYEAVKTDPKAGDRASIEAMIEQHQESAGAAGSEAERRRYHGLVADLKLKLEELTPEAAPALKDAPASTQATPEPQPEPEPTEKPAQAKVVAPEPTHDLKSVDKEPDYRNVVSHIGNAAGPVLNKQVGEMKPKILEWIKTTLEQKAALAGGKLTLQKDVTLYWAVNKALEPKPELASTQAVPEPASDNWQDAIIPIGLPGNGKALEEIDAETLAAITEKMTEIDWETAAPGLLKFKEQFSEAVRAFRPAEKEKPKRAPRKPKEPVTETTTTPASQGSLI